jgi:hypothetical protein
VAGAGARGEDQAADGAAQGVPTTFTPGRLVTEGGPAPQREVEPIAVVRADDLADVGYSFNEDLNLLAVDLNWSSGIRQLAAED